MKELVSKPAIFLLCAVVLACLGTSPAFAQSIQVTAASPSSTAQGTINLDVVISGNGFKRGAVARFFVTGSTNPGGVVVNSTTFSGSGKLTANITVADTAVAANFDVQVLNSDGRTGKGTELFSVIAKAAGPSGCTSAGVPTGWSQAGVVNQGQYLTGAGLGNAVRVTTVKDANGVFLGYAGLAGAGVSAPMVQFNLDANGNVVRSAPTSLGQARDIDSGDIDGDGAPDFVVGAPGSSRATVLFGQIVNGQYSINANRTAIIPMPAKSAQFGWGVAIGDLDNDGRAEVVVGAYGGGSGKNAYLGQVFIYRFLDNQNSTNWTAISGSFTDTASEFGRGVAIGKVTNGPYPDLVVGAPGSNAVVVIADPAGKLGTAGAVRYKIAGNPANNSFGWRVGAADVNGDGVADVVAADNASAQAFSGPILANNPAATYVMVPPGGLAAGWPNAMDVRDFDGDGKADVLVGAPNTAATNCNTSVGSAYLFVASTLSATTTNTGIRFDPPTVEPDFMGFGYGVGLVPALAPTTNPILTAGENGANVNGVAGVGQVYVFRKQ